MNDKGKLVEKTKKAKGVNKSSLKKDITHEDYVNTMNTSETKSAIVRSIRNQNQQLWGIVQDKIVLSPYNDKYMMIDELNNVPYGYERS